MLSVFLGEDGRSFTYQRLSNGTIFKLPKWLTFSPRWNGGYINDELVMRYIIIAESEK